MPTIDFTRFEDADLKAYHEFMNESYTQAKIVSRLAVAVWSLVLKELRKRGLIQLIGSVGEEGLDNPGDCAVKKLW